MSLKQFASALLMSFTCLAASADVSFGSAHALVIDEATGDVLLEKDAGTAAPIASMTKLMTAMVVLDARLPGDEIVQITTDDLDTLKGTTSGVPVGSAISRHDLLQLALIASDNRAAAALARALLCGAALRSAAPLPWRPLLARRGPGAGAAARLLHHPRRMTAGVRRARVASRSD